jgi:prepilin-type N-terminal cleavage/methylation domain-containing protein
MLNKQSAFSLIEVLITLMILSFGIMETGKLLIESHARYNRVAERAEALRIISAVLESVLVDRSGVLVAELRQDWQHKLDMVLPGSVLVITHQKFEDKCIYTVTLSFGSSTQKALTLKAVV